MMIITCMLRCEERLFKVFVRLFLFDDELRVYGLLAFLNKLPSTRLDLLMIGSPTWEFIMTIMVLITNSLFK